LTSSQNVKSFRVDASAVGADHRVSIDGPMLATWECFVVSANTLVSSTAMMARGESVAWIYGSCPG
jgi:hypothetical protein